MDMDCCEVDDWDEWLICVVRISRRGNTILMIGEVVLKALELEVDDL